jgi:hypothetical protein
METCTSVTMKGVELLDIASARTEAVENLADMMTREANPAGHPMPVEVRDSSGLLFFDGFVFANRSVDN